MGVTIDFVPVTEQLLVFAPCLFAERFLPKHLEKVKRDDTSRRSISGGITRGEPNPALFPTRRLRPTGFPWAKATTYHGIHDG